MNNRIISFSGRMGSGKNTYAKLWQQDHPEYQFFSFADQLKEEIFQVTKRIFIDKENIKVIAKEFEVTEEQIKDIIVHTNEGFDIDIFCNHSNPKDYLLERRPFTRWLLQYWGTEVRRNSDKDYWVNKGKVILSSDKPFLVTDSRFINELEMLKELGATLILLDISEEVSRERIFNRDGIILSKEAFKHPSETEFLSFNNWSYILQDEDINDNYNKLIDFLTIGNEKHD